MATGIDLDGDGDVGLDEEGRTPQEAEAADAALLPKSHPSEESEAVVETSLLEQLQAALEAHRHLVRPALIFLACLPFVLYLLHHTKEAAHHHYGSIAGIPPPSPAPPPSPPSPPPLPPGSVRHHTSHSGHGMNVFA